MLFDLFIPPQIIDENALNHSTPRAAALHAPFAIAYLFGPAVAKLAPDDHFDLRHRATMLGSMLKVPVVPSESATDAKFFNTFIRTAIDA
jgi:hypothetical protein